MVKKMKSAGMSIDVIKQMTGLSVDEINKI